MEIQGRFLLGRSSSYANGSTGGASTVALSTAQMPSHSHDQYVTANSGSEGVRFDYNLDQQTSRYYQCRTGAEGSGSAHDNMPPYLAVYMWKRTA